MIDLTGVKHHPAMEEIVEVLCNKTQNTDKGFFRVEVAYFLSKMASAMRAAVVTKDRGEIPVNNYVMALATSGYGKGHSVGIMENEFLVGFKGRFMGDTMPVIAEKSLWEIANKRAVQLNEDPEEVKKEKVDKEYKRKGAYPFTFDSGTAPAVKQLRQKLLMAGIGSINLQIDEIGSNLLANTEVLTLFLELYDQGMVKMKLTKNTSENERDEELDGKTPTNMLLFGTPAKLLDGAQTEDEFYSFLETGYARRCLFGWGQQAKKSYHSLTPKEIYERQTNPTNSSVVSKWAGIFTKLADPTMYEWKMMVDDDVAIKLVEYKMACELAAEAMAEHEDIRKAEMQHRYFKVLKLAGTYAFIDESAEVEMDHLLQAMLLVEESGKAFDQILTREKAYVKLAKYIAAVGTEVTHADLDEALPFYKRSSRQELMTLATAWGYKQNIQIRKSFLDGIEFFRGETLEETDLNNLIASFSDNFAYEYGSEPVPFDQLHVLCLGEARDEDGNPTGPLHWCNHRFKNLHRAEENALPGFNMIVLDVDHGTPLATAVELLKDYKLFAYTTKRHTEQENRFRLILPINYKLELDSDDYKEFMRNILNWLPFTGIDQSVDQRAKKWLSNPGGAYYYNQDGQLLDALKFVPKTQKNEQYLQGFQKIESFSNLERWFAERMAVGNRNNNMIKFALALVDSGMSAIEVEKAVFAFNDKLNTPLEKNEIRTTVLKTVAKRYIP